MNVRMMKKLLEKVNEKLEEKGLSPNSFKAARALMKDLMVTDENLLLTTEDLTSFLDSEMNAPRTERFVEMELYVPGRVVNVWNYTKNPSIVGGKIKITAKKCIKEGDELLLDYGPEYVIDPPEVEGEEDD